MPRQPAISAVRRTGFQTSKETGAKSSRVISRPSSRSGRATRLASSVVPPCRDSCLCRSAFEPAAERNGIRNALEEAAYLQDRSVAEESEQICSIRDLAAKVAARKLCDQDVRPPYRFLSTWRAARKNVCEEVIGDRIQCRRPTCLRANRAVARKMQRQYWTKRATDGRRHGKQFETGQIRHVRRRAEWLHRTCA